jgi:hypothetical protein
MKDELATTAEPVNRQVADEALPKVGEWYWITETEDKEEVWFGCVVHVGSNYAKMRGPIDDRSYNTSRIHFNEFEVRCRKEPNAAAVIAAKVAHFQEAIVSATRQIAEMATRLQLGSVEAPNTTALAVYHDGSMDEYKRDLVKARDESIPELQSAIAQHASCLRSWMQAETLPLLGGMDVCQASLDQINRRIGGVELYAGLVEQIDLLRDGTPAPASEPIHLFQRRHYMDEECLVNYRAGGMRFKHITDFDAWLLEADNLQRLLPHPRSVVAFRVRRKKADSDGSFESFIAMMFGGPDKDMQTFLYMRNGEKISRLTTNLDFGAKLFPDLDRNILQTGKLYAIKDFGDFKRLATEGEHLEHQRREAEFKIAASKLDGSDSEGRHSLYMLECEYSDVSRWSDSWILWNQDSVYFDDISMFVHDQMDDHNRLVLVLQGILDRSEVFQPHPPYKLWVAEDFKRAISLVPDVDRALTPGEEPDFLLYQKQANSWLQKGSLVIGQQEVWLRLMAEEENRRLQERYGYGQRMELKRYKPRGNPGPGLVAKVQSMSAGKVTFTWDKARAKRLNYWDNDRGPAVRAKLTVSTSDILCVDTYLPGDYKKFYADPRTRAKYLKWAPLLLLAEDWRCGKLNPNDDE